MSSEPAKVVIEVELEGTGGRELQVQLVLAHLSGLSVAGPILHFSVLRAAEHRCVATQPAVDSMAARYRLRHPAVRSEEP